MVMVRLTSRMGTEPILSIKRSISIDTMINFDGDGERHGDEDGTCKQEFKQLFLFTDGRMRIFNAVKRSFHTDVK